MMKRKTKYPNKKYSQRMKKEGIKCSISGKKKMMMKLISSNLLSLLPP